MIDTRLYTEQDFQRYEKRISVLPQGVDGPTPILLANEIVSKFKVDWSNPKLRILDPDFTYGSFIFSVYLKLKKFHSDEHIFNNMLFGICRSKGRLLMVKSKLPIKNLYYDDFLRPSSKLKKILNMKKFDVVVGNPPYNDKDRSGNALWSAFILKANNLLSSDGYMSFVVPGRWVLPGYNIKKDKIRLWDFIFSKGTMYHINIGECTKHFKEGSDPDYFSYFLYGKKNIHKKNTKIVTRSDSLEINFNEYRWIPYKRISDMSLKIIKKVEKYRKDNFDVNWKYEQKGVKLKEKKTSEYSIKVFVGNDTDGNPKFKYSNKKSTLHNDSKILFKLGRFLNYTQRVFIDYESNVSYNSSYVCTLSSDENVDYLHSKFFTFLGDCLSNGSEITAAGWKTLPKLDTSIKWNDEMIYQYFHLSYEEILYIQSYFDV